MAKVDRKLKQCPAMYGPIYYKYDISVSEDQQTDFKYTQYTDVPFNGYNYTVETSLFSDVDLTQSVGSMYFIGELVHFKHLSVMDVNLLIKFPEGTLNSEYRLVTHSPVPKLSIGDQKTIFTKGINGSVAGEEFKATITALSTNMRKLEFVMPV
jgi:hypothetical protein